MKKETLRKIIRKTRVGLIRRIINSKPFTKKIHIKHAFITNTDKISIINDELYADDNDPKVFIRFHRPIKELFINMKVLTDFPKDSVELFYSEVGKEHVDFSYNQCYRVGKTDGKLISKNIIFNNPIQHLRLDLGSHKSKIDIKKCEFYPKLSEKVSNYNEYDTILEDISNEKGKKIIIITHALNETGAPILAFNIAKEFKNKDYQVVIVSLSDGPLEEKFTNINVPILSLHQDALSRSLYNPKLFENIVISLYNKGFDKVITNTIISGITVPIFKKYGFNVISLIHEMGMSISLYDMKQGGRDITMYSDKIIFPDKLVYKEFINIFPEDRKKSVIRPQGLYKTKVEIEKDYNRVYKNYNIPPKSKIIMGSGTADFRKGIDLFLSAAQQLIQLEKDFEYHFIWTGKIYNEELENWYLLQLDKYNLKERFHNVDFIKDKEEYQNLVACSDAFWLTSREDPFPSVMIEALEFGTPVLGFKNSGGANTLLDDNRGVLIENFNVNQLAVETDKLLKQPEVIDAMLNKAQKYIDERLNFKKYISFLEEEITRKYGEKYSYADVSVIVPNYNYEEFLPVRLNSIINQTIKPREIIFLDDVSSDKSVEVARKILMQAKKNYKIDYRIITNENNNGCFRQWLKGIKEAKYPYLWIAEADDYAQENFIEELLPAFKNQKVVLSYTQSKVIDENCKVVDYRYTSYTDNFSETKWNKKFIDDGMTQVKEYFSQKNIIPNVSSAIIRKSATEGLENILKNYNVIGDWIAYIYIASKGKIAYSNKALNGHRRHSNSIIARKEKSDSFIEEILKIKKYILENYQLTDNQINNTILSIEGIDNYYNRILNNEILNTLWNKIQEIAKEKRKKENILLALPDLNVGGGQTVAIRIANALTKYYNVFIVNARSNLETDFMKQMINDSIEVLNYNNNINKLKLYKEMLNFKAAISFIWWADKLMYCAFKDSDLPLIISMHGCYEMLLHNPNVDSYFNENVKDMLNRANKIIYTAEKNKEVLEKYNLLSSTKISKIDNGFLLGDYPRKTRDELGIDEDDFVFGLVARAIPEKGYEEAIKAIIELNNKNNKAHLILVGGSDYINELKEKYSKYHFIHFIDKFSLPLEWIGWEELFDVGLLPSYFKSESLPTVIVEYLYLQKPVIATDIAEIKSMLISDGVQAGEVISLKNGKADVKELTKKMEKLMNDKTYYNDLKQNTNILAKRFDMDLCIEKYKDLIEVNNNGKD